MKKYSANNKEFKDYFPEITRSVYYYNPSGSEELVSKMLDYLLATKNNIDELSRTCLKDGASENFVPAEFSKQYSRLSEYLKIYEKVNFLVEVRND